jgi:small-conductance mechanosensitive channel
VKLALSVVRAIGLALLLFVSPATAGPNDGLPKPGATIDRATPRRAFEGFIQAIHAGDFLRAAQFLDLRSVARGKQTVEGPQLAQKLGYVVDRQLKVDVGTLSDAPEGGAGDQALVVVGTVFVEDEPVPISLARVRFDDGVQRWLIARTTVTMIPELYKEHGAHGWEDRLPRVLVTTRFFSIEAWQWLALFVALFGSWAVGFLIGSVIAWLARKIAQRTRTEWDDELVDAARGPVRLIVAVMIVWLVDGPLRLSPAVEKIAHRIAFPVLVIALAWLITGVIGVGAHWIVSRLPDDADAELRSRGLRTQLAVMRRVSSVIVTVIAAAVILMQFEFVRSVGLSLLASAGLVGIVLGFAAQRSLAGIIAGIHLSITQPIRIGDTVVIEGEQGIVEEINLTYVIVKIWDERRLVVPISRILENSFQNWTRVSAELHGVVALQVDYATPVDLVREELERIVKVDPRWDGRTCTLVVLDITERVMTLRALVSARNSTDTFALRCFVREKLMRFVADLAGGKYLPQIRNAQPPQPEASAPGY